MSRLITDFILTLHGIWKELNVIVIPPIKRVVVLKKVGTFTHVSKNPSEKAVALFWTYWRTWGADTHRISVALNVYDNLLFFRSVFVTVPVGYNGRFSLPVVFTDTVLHSLLDGCLESADWVMYLICCSGIYPVESYSKHGQIYTLLYYFILF